MGAGPRTGDSWAHSTAPLCAPAFTQMEDSEMPWEVEPGDTFQVQEGHTSEQAKGQRGLVTRGVQTGALRREWVALWLLEFWGHLLGTPALPQEHDQDVQPPPFFEKSMVLSSSLSRSKRSLNSTLSSSFLSPSFRRFISGKSRSSSWRTQNQSSR